MINKYVFTLQFIVDAGYDGGVSEYNLVSSFNNNKLTVIRDNIKKEIKPCLKSLELAFSTAREEIFKKLPKDHQGQILPKDLQKEFRDNCNKIEEEILKNYPNINKYVKGKMCIQDLDPLFDYPTDWKINRTSMV